MSREVDVALTFCFARFYCSRESTICIWWLKLNTKTYTIAFQYLLPLKYFLLYKLNKKL